MESRLFELLEFKVIKVMKSINVSIKSFQLNIHLKHLRFSINYAPFCAVCVCYEALNLRCSGFYYAFSKFKKCFHLHTKDFYGGFHMQHLQDRPPKQKQVVPFFFRLLYSGLELLLPPAEGQFVCSRV